MVLNLGSLPVALAVEAEVMTAADRDPHPAPSSVPHVAPTRPKAHVSFWIRELPFTLVLILTVAGVAYTSFSKKPIVGYWEVLAPIIAAGGVEPPRMNAAVALAFKPETQNSIII
jgi:hypothetical protein